MVIRRKVLDPITGKERDGTVIEVTAAQEPSSKLTLENGTIITIKHTITEIVLLDQKGPDGKPIYNFTANATVNIYPSDNDQ